MQNNQNHNQISNHKPDVVACPLCDGFKIKAEGEKQFAVCFKCKQRYLKEAASLALGGTTPPVYEEWLVEKITANLPALQETLEQARKKVETLKGEQVKLLNEGFEKRVGGIVMSQEVEDEARRTYWADNKERVWKDLGGNAAIRNLHMAEDRLEEAKKVLADLKAKAETPSLPSREDSEESSQASEESGTTKPHKNSRGSKFSEGSDNHRGKPEAPKSRGRDKEEDRSLVVSFNSGQSAEEE